MRNLYSRAALVAFAALFSAGFAGSPAHAICAYGVPCSGDVIFTDVPFNRPLGVGSKGTDVLKLQQILYTQGYLTTEPTGYFGALTKKATADFQTASGLEGVGTVGPRTRTLLGSTVVGNSPVRQSTQSQSGDDATEINPQNTFNPKATITPGATAPALYLTASQSKGDSGYQVSVSWYALHTTSCSASGAWSGKKDIRGTEAFTGSSNSETFTLTCTGEGGSVARSINLGESMMNSGATGSEPTPTLKKCLIDSCTRPVPLPLNTTGESTGSQAARVTTENGPTSGDATEINPQNTFQIKPKPKGIPESSSDISAGNITVEFSASNSSVGSGKSTKLSWSSKNATTCVASNAWYGTLALTGSRSVTPSTTSTYVLTCSNATGTVQKSVRVGVSSYGPGEG